MSVKEDKDAVLINQLEKLNLNKRYNIKESTRSLFFFPEVIRCIVNGSSGCGKTNLILNLMLKMFEKSDSKIKLNICTKTIEQELYQSFIKDIETNYKQHKIETSTSLLDFGDEYFQTINKNYREVIIIDDMLGVMSKDEIKALIHLFSASRPRKISIFFLTQRYNKVEISCRRNCNYIITFKPSLEEAISICQELIGSFIYPSELIARFKNNGHFSLFFDLEKTKMYSVYEIFNISNTNYYSSLDDLINKLIDLEGEEEAGNDSLIIKNEINNILQELENNLILVKN